MKSIRRFWTTYEKLGIPLHERKALLGIERGESVAVDAVFDSVSVATTFQEEAGRDGDHLLLVRRSRAESSGAGEEVPRLGCSLQRQLFRHAELRRLHRWLFCYIPKGVRCPMELSTYFRINAKNTGQFERTLIIADEGA